jgi:hypothetical protein
MDWTQLHRTISLTAAMCLPGSESVPKSRNGVMDPAGPRYAQMMPPDSWTG